MGKIISLFLVILGIGAGVAGGIALRPDKLGPPDESSEPSEEHETAKTDLEHGKVDYVKLSNQFVIPVMRDADVTALVVLSLSLEVATGGQEIIYEREPKLRDAFLQVLFDHANAGGFDGVFTNGRNLEILRDALQETAVKTLGPSITDVLIVDVVRQDIR